MRQGQTVVIVNNDISMTVIIIIIITIILVIRILIMIIIVIIIHNREQYKINRKSDRFPDSSRQHEWLICFTLFVACSSS